MFNDIGTGKTLNVAWAMHHLMNLGLVKRVLIIAPLSTLNIVWERTLFRVDPTLNVKVLKGTADQKRAGFGEVGSRLVRIINPDSVHILSDAPTEPYDLIIVDESATFRTAKTRRAKGLIALCKKVKGVWMMTGSPMPEAPTDVWLTARIVCPDRVPRYFGQMRDKTMRKITQFKWEAVEDADTIVGNMLRGYVIRFDRDQCLDLPPTQYVTHECGISAQAQALMKQLRKEAAAEVEAGMITAGNEAVLINKILQVVSGCVKASKEGHNDVLQMVDVEPKFQALRELIDGSRQPLIIYSNFIGALARIQMWLREQGVSHRLVYGNTSADNRTKAFDDVQASRVKVLLAHPRAMAHGITLTTANVIVWWTPIFSHEISEQATGRIIRAGQTHKTYVVHLVSSAIERQVLKRLTGKERLQGLLLDWLASGDN